MSILSRLKMTLNFWYLRPGFIIQGQIKFGFFLIEFKYIDFDLGQWVDQM